MTEKKNLFDLLLLYILQSGFNKNIQDEELNEIHNEAGYEQNEQNVALMRHWITIIKKVLENPLEIRRTKAINELVNSGISREDAENAINKIVGITSESRTDHEIDVVQNINKIVMKEITEPEIISRPKPIKNQKQLWNMIIVQPKIVEFPPIDLIKNLFFAPKTKIKISSKNPKNITGTIYSNTKLISTSISSFSINSQKSVLVYLKLHKNAPKKESKNLIKEAITVKWPGGIKKIDCKYSVVPIDKNLWGIAIWIALLFLIIILFIAIGSQYIY